MGQVQFLTFWTELLVLLIAQNSTIIACGMVFHVMNRRDRRQRLFPTMMTIWPLNA